MNTEFDTIESAQEFLALLREAVEDAKRNTDADIIKEGNLQPSRRLDALRLVMFKLDKLDQHVKDSCRLLNDLRSLRRLLLEERLESTTGRNDVGPRAVAS
jgi:hypothetical protein